MYRIFICILLTVLSSINASAMKIIPVDDNFKDVLLYNSKDIKSTNSDKSKIFKFEINNLSKKNKTLYLIFDNPLIDSIIVINDNNNDTISLIGDVIKFNSNNLLEPSNVSSFSLKSKQCVRLIIIEKKQPDELTTKVYLSSQNTYLQKSNHDNLILGIFFGTFFMFLILIIAIYIYNNNRYFILYGILSLLSLLICIYFSGVGHQYIYHNNIFLKQYLALFLISGYLIVHTSFIYSFFNISESEKFIKIPFYIIISCFALQVLYIVCKLFYPSLNYVDVNYDYISIYILFILYSILLLFITIYTYLKSKKKETFWILIGAIFQFISWLLFYNNLFELSYHLSKLNDIKFYPSHLFFSHINIAFIFIEIFIISTVICINYINLLKEHNKTIVDSNLLYQNNLATYFEGETHARSLINNLLHKKTMNKLQYLKNDINSLFENDDKIKIELDELIDKIDNDIEVISNWQIETELITLDSLLYQIQQEFKNLIQFNYSIPNNIKEKQIEKIKLIHLKFIITECINNTIKHAKDATQIMCDIEFINNYMLLTITDNSCIKPKIKKEGMGLLSIQQRVKSMNGKVVFNNEERFSINITIPHEF